MAQIFNINGDDYNQRLKFTIDGALYNIHIYWNVRSGWYLGLYDVNNDPIVLGQKLMPNDPLAAEYNIDGLYAGELYCVDTSPITGEDGLEIDNFGTDRRYQLIYFTAQELQKAITAYNSSSSSSSGSGSGVDLSITASQVSYNNTFSTLTTVNVQNAIDELDGKVEQNTTGLEALGVMTQVDFEARQEIRIRGGAGSGVVSDDLGVI